MLKMWKDSNLICLTDSLFYQKVTAAANNQKTQTERHNYKSIPLSKIFTSLNSSTEGPSSFPFTSRCYTAAFEL